MKSVNLVDGKRFQGVIRNYSLPYEPSMHELFVQHEVICNLGQSQRANCAIIPVFK
jgi:hypothetical protein